MKTFKIPVATALTWTIASLMTFAIQATDYSSLNGLQGAALKNAVKEIALPHTVISYGDKTWEAFAQADVRNIWDGTKMREAWFDMYSNRLVWVEGGHSGMNIEHAVANSWWGGQKNDAYKDLHHLNPSDADANNRKNNNPLGIIDGKPSWSNGLTNIGRPVYGNGGGAATVFEPADEYKGDFARAYFYIFTVYDDIAWQTEPAYMYDLSAYPTLQPWAYEMLLDWAANDPVDEREAQRNSIIAGIQMNENPFVAIPGLAEYVWGAKKNTPFNLAEAQTKPLLDRPEAPVFSQWGEFSLAGVNTYVGRWWDAFLIDWVTFESEYAYYSISDSLNPDAEEEWKPVYFGIEIPAAKEAGQTLTIKAYTSWYYDRERPSSISTLTLTAVDPASTDYMNARWQKVTDASRISSDGQYILVASKANAVMSTSASATSSSGYMGVAGNVDINEDGEITRLPEEAAVIEFVEAGGGQYYVEVNNLRLEPAGFLTTPVVKKVELSEEGMPALVTLSPEKNVKINFGAEYGTLQYNAQSPRFSVYTSNQQALDLYMCVQSTVSGVECPAIVPAEPSATRIFTLDGIEISGDLQSLPGGIYIVVDSHGARKVAR
ncbi:MAG: endonuclease [Muribaculaceae bacterium]|nr:endonuclease [Muribaculaceae bacterium]